MKVQGVAMAVGMVITLAACPSPPARTRVVETPAVDGGARRVEPNPICPTDGRAASTNGAPPADVGRLFPVESWHTVAAAFAGEDLVLARYVVEINGARRELGAVERWSLADGKAPRARFFVPEKIRAMAPTKDGASVVIAAEKEMVVRSLATGAIEARFAVERGLDGPLLAIGQGDGLLVLATSEQVPVLFDRKGTALQHFPIAGMTPTIVRRYGVDAEHPTMHENILRNSQSWPTSFAATDDGRRIAIGGSDGKVRLIDRTTKRELVLDHKWTFVDRRRMGANPDLNVPLAMRFGDGAKKLVVAFAHGEISTWSTDGGALLDTVSAACTPDEASAVANRFKQPNEPRVAPTADDEQQCSRAHAAAFAPDGSWVAMDGELVRVRKLPSGAPLAMIPDEPDTAGPDKLVTSASGVLAMGDIYGSVRTWSKGAVTPMLAKAKGTSPIEPRLTSGGRYLVWDGGPLETRTVWDVAKGTAVMGPTKDFVAAADGGRFLRGTATALEVLGKAGERVAAFSTSETHRYGPNEPILSRDGELVVAPTTNDAIIAIHRVSTRASTTLAVDKGTWARVLSADGKTLATFGNQTKLEIWDVASKTSKGPFESDVEAVAFFGDGGLVAIGREGPKKKEFVLRVHGANGALLREAPVPGYALGVAVSPDDAEIAVLLSGAVARFDAKTLAVKTDTDIGYIGARRIAYATAGPTILFENYGGVDIRRRSDLGLVARIAALSSGGWMASSTSGAVQGSPGAEAETVLVTNDAVEVGKAAFERARSPYVVACALAGTSL